MYINSVGHYIPEKVVDNKYFEQLHGFDDNWLFKRTGILERRRATSEDINVMAINAVSSAKGKIPYDISEVDTIVGATYSYKDTLNTIAHQVQHEFDIKDTRALTVSSACSSLINALEVAQAYIISGKSKKAIVVASEHNSAYSDDSDKVSGHLWGDGAVAFFISKERLSENDIEIKDIKTKGLATVGRSIEGVKLEPAKDGITMPFGRDVFNWACKYMTEIVKDVVEENHYKEEDIDYVIPHQANVRIIENVRKQLGFSNEQVLTNIEKCGNTGCASVGIVFSQNQEKFRKGNKIALTVFGGGYSCGAVLMEK